MLGRRGVLKWLTRSIAAVAMAAATAFSVQPAQATDANYASIVIDAKTGEVLYSRNADAQRFPASLTKMMTLYLLFEDLERGRVTLRTRLDVSANAAAQAPTKLGVPAGSTIRVEDAILALITKSANDVAVVIAENLAGSVSSFATRMTTTARALGMTRTTFQNPHGLPNSNQVTTARDMATLGRALQDRFPQYYGYFATESFVWNGVRISNHNNLLDMDGVDGIKTGYTNASGYNLVTSIHRDGRYVVAVVMGGDSAAWRDQHMRDLINTYLPRASTGPRTAPLVVAAAAAVPAPLPRENPVRTDPIMTAGIAAPVQVAAVGPVAVPAPIPNPGATNPGAPTGGAPDAIAVLAQGDFEVGQPPATGWRIQIGAFPLENSAQAVLAAAMRAEAGVLANTVPYTEPVAVDGNTHYRARFGGFASSAAAQAACNRLIAHDFACYPTQ
ncbi:MAG: D-alanyl-D-alanine carboxypeptidase [Bauldia sp.]|nr:D-alanyl-D-alanine carboxypeptidase [Bauldia sp.]